MKNDNHLLAKIGQYALIFNDQNELLLLQRKRSKSWSLPGGRLDKGEDWQKAFIREITEETNLRVKDFEPVAVALVEDSFQVKYCVFFRVEVKTLFGLKINSQEHGGYRFFGTSGLKDLMIDGYPEFTKVVIDYLK